MADADAVDQLKSSGAREREGHGATPGAGGNHLQSRLSVSSSPSLGYAVAVCGSRGSACVWLMGDSKHVAEIGHCFPRVSFLPFFFNLFS